MALVHLPKQHFHLFMCVCFNVTFRHRGYGIPAGDIGAPAHSEGMYCMSEHAS